MRRIETVNDIDTATPEGRLLLMAISKITTESQTDKTPDEVIGQINKLADEVDNYENRRDKQFGTRERTEVT